MKQKTIIIASALLLFGNLMFAAPGGAKVGKPLPQWKAGYLDIHAINSGRGECTLVIMPDGTTMMIDAGEYCDKQKDYVKRKPSKEVRPYKVYVDYARHFLPAVCCDSLDYFLLTHYHMDHIGHNEKAFSTDPDGGYKLTGVTAVYSELPFRHLVDRSYPDYSEAINAPGTDDDFDFYKDFVKYSTENRGLVAEKFELGSTSQFGAKYDTTYNCIVSNLAANGAVWTGEKAIQTEKCRENGLSCGIRIDYGRFGYWTSGDLNHTPAVKLTSKYVGKVDAMKCLHHMSNTKQVLSEAKKLKPKVIVTQNFYVRKDQPNQEIIEALAPKYDLFFTNIDKSLVNDNPELYEQCKSLEGHIVIRVFPGGKRFFVYVLDDVKPGYRVKAIYGPYNSSIK
ncbi:MAG: hypothetical protein HUJ95_04420 [Bacteroidales bacterium]|nr:hypothetical protein [Bacteroidales bacterium]